MAVRKNILIGFRYFLIWPFKALIIISAFWAAFLLRFDFSLPTEQWQVFLALLPPLLLIKLVVFRCFGLSHGWWRYVSIPDVIVLAKANLTASALIAVYIFLTHTVGVPRSVLILDGTFCFLISCGIRFVTRAWRERYLPMPLAAKRTGCVRTLLYGAGQGGQLIAREIRQNPKLQIELVGFIDDDPAKRNLRIQGLPVLGGRDELARVCCSYHIDEIIIAIPSARGQRLRELVELCRGSGVQFKTLPGVSDLIDGSVTIQHIRPVDLEDLLGREPVCLDRNGIRSYLEGKRVLVTGAAGSIGSELCRQMAQFRPGKLILLDNAESPLFQIERELAEAHPDLHLVAVIGDVRERSRVEGVFDNLLPQVVFHAAAYKHVPMMEANPAEAIRNNVHGTRVVADAAVKLGVERMVMVSTDKAVNPTNIMGASKRAAELYVQGLAQHSRTQFVTVRFGNVLGSAGSVIPIFREQILKGGPVTVTHPEVTRFFMTIPEASQLVLQAGSMGQGGEIFVLDMGTPVKIADLAAELIRLSGHEPETEIEIVYTGLRPGEKLYEELLIDGEGVVPTCHEKISVARSIAVDFAVIAKQCNALDHAACNMDIPQLLALLRCLVPEYTPTSNGHPWHLDKRTTVPAIQSGKATPPAAAKIDQLRTA